jgi:diguanylate cyclase (GGDEF)-like protein
MTYTAYQQTNASSLDSFEKKNVHKRARLRRQMYVAQAASYGVDSLILLLYHFAGTTPRSTPLLYFFAGACWTALTLALSEFRINDRFADHYLTVPQSIGAISIQLAAIYLAPEVGFYFACIIFVILGFGALRMTARQTAVVWTYATVGLTAVFVCTSEPITMPMVTPFERNLALLCLVTALGRCAFTGLYGASLREALYRRGNELKSAYARIEELAQTDELTGVLNRRYIMKALNDEAERAQRGGTPLSIAIIDLDFFKRINDTYGHPAGDEVLKSMAIALASNIRHIDRLGRYGGEEFLLVFPGSGEQDAVAAIDRLRGIVATIDWNAISSNLRVTMSAGVAQVRSDEAPSDALNRADKALYQAKDAGRNCVIGSTTATPHLM